MILRRQSPRASALVAITLMALAGRAPAQDPLTRFDRTIPPPPFTRPGSHHLATSVRVVDFQGRALVGIPVVVYARTTGWGGMPWPVAETKSGADGVARFDDLSSPHPMICQIEPAEGYLPATRGIDAVATGSLDLGTVKLQGWMPLQASFEIFAADGSKFETRDTRITIRKPDAPPFGRSVASATATNGAAVLEHVPPGEYRIEVSTWTGTPTPFSRFEANLTVEPAPEKRHLRLSARLAADRPTSEPTTMEGWAERLKPGVLEIAVAEPSAAPASRPTHERKGRLVDSRGAPVAGARVRGFASAFFELSSRSAYAVTDADGRFSVSTNGDPFTHVIVEAMAGTLNFELGGPLVKKPVSLEEVALEDSKSVTVEIEGQGAGSLVASRAIDGVWFPCAVGSLGRFLSERRMDFDRGISVNVEPAVVRLETAGTLPVVTVIRPGSSRLSVHLASPAPFEVEVRAQGKPVAGAIVDVETSVAELSGEFLEVASLRTAADGTIKSTGDPARSYRVFAYAPRCTPARGVWRAGERLVLDLVPRDSAVTISGLSEDERAIIRRSGAQEIVAAVAFGAPPLSLDAGRFEAVVLDDKANVVRGASFSPEKRRAIALAADGRSRVAINLPAGEDPAAWTAWLTRTIPAQGSVGWAATSGAGNFGATVAESAMLEPVNGAVVVAASGSGRYFLSLRKKDGAFTLRREVQVAPDANLSISIRPLDAHVEGSRKQFETAKFSHHGVAGPRLVLSAETDPESATAWDVVVGLPEADEDGRFALRGIPHGTYVALDHLKRTTRYGGTSFVAKPGETVTLPDFGDGATGALEVTVADASGAPLKDAAVSIYDPMSESWQAFLEIPTTGRFADQPIPEPPVRPIESGRASFSRIRAGVLPLEVLMPDGTRHRLWRTVAPGTPVRIELPPAPR